MYENMEEFMLVMMDNNTILIGSMLEKSGI